MTFSMSFSDSARNLALEKLRSGWFYEKKYRLAQPFPNKPCYDTVFKITHFIFPSLVDMTMYGLYDLSKLLSHVSL